MALFSGDALKTLFTPKGEGVLGIDIGTSSIKIVQLHKDKGVAYLDTYGELSLGPYANSEVGQATNLPPEKIAEALKDLMKEAGVTATTAGMTIPFASTLISTIELPKAVRNELQNIIPLEARKYIPVPINEVSLDWFVLPDDEARLLSPGGQSVEPDTIKVILVAIHNDILTRYQTIASQLGISVTFFEIEIFSAIRSVVEQSAAPVAVLDIGAGTSKLYIVEYGIIQRSHVINRGSQTITQSLATALGVTPAKAEQVKRQFGLESFGHAQAAEAMSLTLGYILSETGRAILNFEKKASKNVGMLLLTGGGAGLKGLAEHAAKQVSLEVKIADPFQKVEGPVFLEEVLKDAGPTFSVALGCALRKLQEQG